MSGGIGVQLNSIWRGESEYAPRHMGRHVRSIEIEGDRVTIRLVERNLETGNLLDTRLILDARIVSGVKETGE